MNINAADYRGDRVGIFAVVLLGWILLCGSTAAAGDAPAFSLSKLSVADELLDLSAEDLNADGLKDMLIVHRKGLPPDQTRWISIFLQTAAGGFSTAADQSWELDTAAAVLDIGDVAGDSGKEICYLTGEAVRYYPLNSTQYDLEPQTLFAASGLTVFPSKNRIPLINFIRDWNGDERDEVGIVGFDGLAIHAPDAAGKFSAENKILVELTTGMGRESDDTEDDFTAGLSARFTFPNVRLIDFDSDGSKDLIATTDERVIVYRQEADGRFTAQPTSDVRFDVRTQHEKIEGIADVETVVQDLNNDGYADAIVTKQTSKGLSNFRGVINIFWGKPGGYGAVPDQVIISEGTASDRALIRDVNGDGRKDLILPSIKISITSIIRWLITRSIPINFNIFLMKESGVFSDQPDFTKEVKFKIDWSGESDTQAMDLDGDFNGDKRKDFVFATDEDILSVYLGVEDGERLFSNKPVAEVNADAFGVLNTYDLNNDGYSDMVIHYPQAKERKGMVQVLMNQRVLK